jgi:ethanolamine utilization protein EutA
MLTHKHDHDHDHDSASGGAHTHLLSVGIDIGSSTSHLMFSELSIGYLSTHRRRPEVLERKVIGRSPVLLTPFAGDWNIEAEPLRKLIDATFKSMGLSREKVDTGAVIVTGEAARRDNAKKIVEMFSDEAGRFVCATAGPRLEALLAAHGSGAVERSRDDGSVLLNVDLGGGTTKISLIDRGVVHGMAAINIGARLVACDASHRLIRLEWAGDHFLREMGYAVTMGESIGETVLEELAVKMSAVLFDALAGDAAEWDGLFVTPPMTSFPQVEGIVFSGGVSEYIYGRERNTFGDLGPLLGKQITDQARARGYRILDSSEGIRATVIGASQYSVQLSGETIFVADSAALPFRNLRVFVVPVSWESPVTERAEKAVRKAIEDRDPEVRGHPFALAFSSPPFVGYGVTQELATGIDRALRRLLAGDRPQVLVFQQNVGRVIGGMLSPELGIACVDELSLSELDFIDVGEFVAGESYVPVVVKSLAFGA